MIELEGKHTDARILGVEEVEEDCMDQIQGMIDHEVFSDGRFILGSEQ